MAPNGRERLMAAKWAAQDDKTRGVTTDKTFRDGVQMTFQEFWRLYLDVHRHPLTRRAGDDPYSEIHRKR